MNLKRKTLLGAILLSSWMLGARSARATETNWYTAGDFCYPSSSYNWSTLDYSTSESAWIGVTLKSQGAYIVCPIVKTTSGPTVYGGDDVYRIDLDVNVTSTGSLKCSYDVLSTTSTDQNANNVIGGYPITITSTGRQTVSFYPSNPPQGFWGNSSAWKYAQLWCTSNGANVHVSLIQYAIYENGTDTTDRIYPAAIGAPGGDMTCNWKLAVDANPEGYVESEDEGDYDWQMGGMWWDGNLKADIAYSRNIEPEIFAYITDWENATSISIDPSPNYSSRSYVIVNQQFNNDYWGFDHTSAGVGDNRLWSVRTHN